MLNSGTFGFIQKKKEKLYHFLLLMHPVTFGRLRKVTYIAVLSLLPQSLMALDASGVSSNCVSSSPLVSRSRQRRVNKCETDTC